VCGRRRTATGRNPVFPWFLREPIQGQSGAEPSSTQGRGARAARDPRASDPIARRHEGVRTQRPVRAARMEFLS
jgi:hypothetical protein